jgi:hypothetical protein
MQPRNFGFTACLPLYPSLRLLLEDERNTKSLWNSCGWLCKRETYISTPMKYGKFGLFIGKDGWLRPSTDVGYLHEESPT